MKMISSTSGKRLPVIATVIGLVGFVMAILVAATQSHKPGPEPELFLPLIVVPFIGYVFYKLFYGLADEVWDDGSSLVVKYKGLQIRIPLADVVNVSYSAMTNPPRVMLLLRSPTPLGKEIAFIVQRPYSFRPFARNAIVDDLILRIDAARRAK